MRTLLACTQSLLNLQASLGLGVCDADDVGVGRTHLLAKFQSAITTGRARYSNQDRLKWTVGVSTTRTGDLTEPQSTLNTLELWLQPQPQPQPHVKVIQN